MFDKPGLLHALLLALVVAALYALRKRLPGTRLGRAREPIESTEARRRRRQLIALECTELALAGVFFLVGGAKLIGRHDMVELFRSIGVGQWLRYVTGALEVVGAAFMIVPFASGASAVMLGTVMISATLIELFVLRRPPVAAMACLSAHTYVAWGRLVHRAAESTQTLSHSEIESMPVDAREIELIPADAPTMVLTPNDPPSEILLHDHPSLHGGLDLALAGPNRGVIEHLIIVSNNRLLDDHRALHVGMNVAGVRERAGGVEGSCDRGIRVDARDVRGCPCGGIEEDIVPH